MVFSMRSRSWGEGSPLIRALHLETMGAQYRCPPDVRGECGRVGVVGFEPTTLTSQRSGSSR